MVRLSYVEFWKPTKMANNATMSEIASDMFGEMFLEPGVCVKIGGYEWPLSSIMRWKPMAKEEQGGETCPECKGWFMNATGLGAHRAHKHGVKGARSRE